MSLKKKCHIEEIKKIPKDVECVNLKKRTLPVDTFDATKTVNSKKTRIYLKAERKKAEHIEKKIISDGCTVLHVGFDKQKIGTVHTMLSTDGTQIYTVKTNYDNYNNFDKNMPNINYSCNCGEQYGIKSRNNCKHIGYIVGYSMKQFTINCLVKDTKKEKIENDFANLQIK
jgi:hypothetical protein